MRHRAGFWVLLSLAAVLCFLGFLQYRWIDQLSKAEHEREQQVLRTAMNRIAAALDIEVTRAQIAFAPMPPDLENGPFWADRMQMWTEFAPYPRIIKDVYFSDQKRTFKITSSGTVPVEGEIQTGTDPVSVMPAGRPDIGPAIRTIVFDGEYIQKDLLPRFTSRYLNTDRFGVRVSAGEQVLYAKNDFITEATTRMFAFRPECFNGPMRRDRRRGPPWMDNGASFIARSDVTCADVSQAREPGRWTLEVGMSSLAVTGLHEFRTRSLLLSFGVLTVLGTGIVMLTLYAHRAQILAQRQMEFAMAVSHELRTPLTVIRVAADNLADGLVADPKRYGDMIRRETVRLSDMVEQVLVFARTQRADIKPHFESVSPSDVIERALSAVGSSLDSAGMTVECDVAADLPAMHADANLVSAGLQNLLINAAKYAGAGGVVRVRAEQREQSRVSIVVQDDGPGVKQSELERIFSPFYRGADAANSKVPGLGLGLHLVKRIAEAHGGYVRAANRVGRGFEIEMRIPAVES